MKVKMKKALLSSSVVAVALGATAYASPFSSTGLVVMQLDNSAGGGANSSAVAMSLHEYSQSTGQSLQTINLSTGSVAFSYDIGPNRDGIFQRSQDGQYIAVGGYNVAAGTAGDPATNASANRVIVRLGANGVPDYSTQFNDSLVGTQLRSVASFDGSGFYATGANNSNSLTYVPFGGSSSTVISTGNWRAAHVANSQLYAVSGSSGFRGVSTVGTGLPTTSQGASFTTISPSPNPASGPGVNSIFFADANTIYAAGTSLDASGDDFRQYRFNGTSWVIQSFTASPEGASSAYGVAAVPNPANPALFDVYLSTSAGVYKITDDPTDSTFPSLNAASRFIDAPAGTVFRGLALSPVPEPGAVTIVAISATGLLRRRRR